MIWTVQGEFSDLAHNNIAKPDRTVNNTTLWVPDFSRAHMDMLFYDGRQAQTRWRNYYIEQSSGRYTVAGDVTDWIPVRRYADRTTTIPTRTSGTSCKTRSTAGTTRRSRPARRPAEINEYLSQFDKCGPLRLQRQRRVQRAGRLHRHLPVGPRRRGRRSRRWGPGCEAIWSHSWYAYSNLIGTAGPDFNKLGGIQIGNSDYWVGKYTIQPENGGVGVFTHEYGHDLGLPDLYDTSGGENGTGFWTSCPPAPGWETAPWTSAPSPATWAPGRSSSSAG